MTPGTRLLANWVGPRPSPGLKPRFPCLQVRILVIIMASSVCVGCVGLWGYVNKFVDSTDEEGELWREDQWQDLRYRNGWQGMKLLFVLRGWNRNSTTPPLGRNFFSLLYECIHLRCWVYERGPFLSKEAGPYIYGNPKYCCFSELLSDMRTCSFNWPDYWVANTHVITGRYFKGKMSPV